MKRGANPWIIAQQKSRQRAIFFAFSVIYLLYHLILSYFHISSQ